MIKNEFSTGTFLENLICEKHSFKSIILNCADSRCVEIEKQDNIQLNENSILIQNDEEALFIRMDTIQQIKISKNKGEDVV